jgi:hypothetical protein
MITTKTEQLRAAALAARAWMGTEEPALPPYDKGRVEREDIVRMLDQALARR